jgi:hypothetical protein
LDGGSCSKGNVAPGPSWPSARVDAVEQILTISTELKDLNDPGLRALHHCHHGRPDAQFTVEAGVKKHFDGQTIVWRRGIHRGVFRDCRSERLLSC